MKIRRKLVTFVIALAFAVLFVGGNKCYAADMIPIQTNTDITDALQTGTDVKYYVFTVDKTGYINISLKKSNPTADADWGWMFQLYDMDGNCLREFGAITTSFETPNLNYAAGTRLYIKVYAYNDRAYAPVGDEFVLNVKSTMDSSWEQEPNDTMSSATLLKPYVKKYGTMIYSSDEDYYSYTVDRTGYFTIDFAKVDPTANAKWGWSIDMYDVNGNCIYTYNDITTSYTTQKFNFSNGTKIYLKISAKNTAPYVPRDVPYMLTVNAVSKNNWEIETQKSADASWNSRISRAAKLTSKKIYGSLWKSSDNDIYKLSVPKTGKVTLRFYPNNVDTNVGWGYDVEIYNKNGTRHKVYSKIKSNYKNTFYAKKGTYYIVVKANYPSYAAYAPSAMDAYAITATTKASTVPSMKSKKVTYSTKNATIKWKKVKQIDGYEIQLCKNKKFKKSNTSVYTTSSKALTLGWNISKGTYYVRVRAYRESVTGDKIYGKFTKVKKIVKK